MKVRPPVHSPHTGVIVTGGASGLGLASAHALAAIGRPIALWDIDGDAAQGAAAELKSEYGIPALGIGADVREPDAVVAAIALSREGLPSIGGLVHSAGTGDHGGIEGFDVDRFDRGIAVHVRAIPLIVHHLLDDLRRHPGSAIIAMSSMQARLGNGSVPTYTAAKGAVLSLMHSMADALAGHGIRINSVSPGMIRTPLLERGIPAGPIRDRFLSRCLLGRFGEPEDVARTVRFLMSDEASYITGTDVIIDGGFLVSTPKV